jgi:uncharacterized membrane protein (DUF485 family)
MNSNARIGFRLFLIYLLLYGGFVLVNAFAPEKMEATPIAGVNIAILYGFGLIVAAFVMALIYGWICKLPPRPNPPTPRAGQPPEAEHRS